MALFLFTKSIIEGKSIKVFNHGDMTRDFTYIDDIVESIIRLIDKPAKSIKNYNKLKPDPSSSWAPFRIFNIGNSNPTKLMEYIKALENTIGKTAYKEFLPMQPGDVPVTEADTSLLEEYIGFKPRTSINEGIREFVNWYKSFYSV